MHGVAVRSRWQEAIVNLPDLDLSTVKSDEVLLGESRTWGEAKTSHMQLCCLPSEDTDKSLYPACGIPGCRPIL